MKLLTSLENCIDLHLTAGLNHILALLNRDFTSENVGSFDKNYWYYKKTAFSNGMRQNYLYSLGLFLKQQHQMPQSAVAVQFSSFTPEMITGYIQAAIRYTLTNSHANGSLDEHYYNEQSLVATAFAGISIFRALRIFEELQIPFEMTKKEQHRLELLLKWVASHDEDASIANHVAGACLCLLYGYRNTQNTILLWAAMNKIDQLLKLQNPEGWFIEYSGLDVGYLTLTLDFLTEIQQFLHNEAQKEFPAPEKQAIKAHCLEVTKALGSLIEFFDGIYHPAFPWLGYTGSRNTAHFFISGFCRILAQSDASQERGRIVSKQYLLGFIDFVQKNLNETMADDEFLYFQYNDLLYSYIPIQNVIKQNEKIGENRPVHMIKNYPNANFLIIFHGKSVAALTYGSQNAIQTFSSADSSNFISTGIAIKFVNGALVHSFDLIDAEKSVEINDGSLNKNSAQKNRLQITGFLCEKQEAVLTPWKQVLMTAAGMTLMKIENFNRAMKRWLVKKVISTRKKSPIKMISTITLLPEWELLLEYQLQIPQNITGHIEACYWTHGINVRYTPSGEYYRPNQYIPNERIELQQIEKRTEQNTDIWIIRRSITLKEGHS